MSTDIILDTRTDPEVQIAMDAKLQTESLKGIPSMGERVYEGTIIAMAEQSICTFQPKYGPT